MLAARDGGISEHFGAAPFVALWEKRTSDGAVLHSEIVENPFTVTEKGKGLKGLNSSSGRGSTYFIRGRILPARGLRMSFPMPRSKYGTPM
jgi:predicted Fe-Mo cluster-binding NifX family protein